MSSAQVGNHTCGSGSGGEAHQVGAIVRRMGGIVNFGVSNSTHYDCRLTRVLLIPLWRPAARRARNLATPPATRERTVPGGLSIGPLPWLGISTSDGGTPAVGVRQLAFAMRCAAKRPHCLRGPPRRRPEGGGVRPAKAGRALVSDEVPSPTPPYPGRVWCCEDTGLWLGPLGVKGP